MASCLFRTELEPLPAAVLEKLPGPARSPFDLKRMARRPVLLEGLRHEDAKAEQRRLLAEGYVVEAVSDGWLKLPKHRVCRRALVEADALVVPAGPATAPGPPPVPRPRRCVARRRRHRTRLEESLRGRIQRQTRRLGDRPQRYDTLPAMDRSLAWHLWRYHGPGAAFDGEIDVRTEPFVDDEGDMTFTERARTRSADRVIASFAENQREYEAQQRPGNVISVVFFSAIFALVATYELVPGDVSLPAVGMAFLALLAVGIGVGWFFTLREK